MNISQERTDALLQKATWFLDGMDSRDARRYRLHLLPDVIRRLQTLGDQCDVCLELFQELEEMLGALVDEGGFVGGQKEMKHLQNRLNGNLKHLEQEHGIVPRRHHQTRYQGIGVVAGLMIGIFAGPQTLGIGIGILLGLVGGYAFGLVLARMAGKPKDLKAEQEDRVIG